MTMWIKNQSVAALRRATLLIYEDDGVTPAPMATDFTGCVTIRRGGSSYVAAAGSLVNVGVDGEWYYEATQAETNIDATEIVIKVDKTAFATSRSIAVLGFAGTTWIKNQSVVALRRATLLIYEDDGVTPAPMATDFTGDITIREGAGAYVAASGVLTNVGVDGEWYYQATQAETDVIASEVVIKIDKATFATSRSIVTIAQTTPVPIGAMMISNIAPDPSEPPGSPGAFSSVFSVARVTPVTFQLTGIPVDAEVTIAVKFDDRDETYVALDVEGNWVWPFDVGCTIGDLTAEPVNVSILPRGGWRSGGVSFAVAAAVEATE